RSLPPMLCARTSIHSPSSRHRLHFLSLCFFLTAPAPTEIYTLSLHDALPISGGNNPARAADAGDGFLFRRGYTVVWCGGRGSRRDRKSTRLNSSHVKISYAVFCLKKKKKTRNRNYQIIHDTHNNHTTERQVA